jgi:hypothetical protein
MRMSTVYTVIDTESEMVLCYPLIHTPQTTHNVYVYCIIFSALWNRE